MRRPDHAAVTSTLFSIKPSHLLSAIFDDTDFLDWKLIGLLTSATFFFKIEDALLM